MSAGLAPRDGGRHRGGAAAPDASPMPPHYLCLRSEGRTLSGLVEAFARENVFVSVRGSSIRITPHVYNTEEDLQRMVGVLAQR